MIRKIEISVAGYIPSKRLAHTQFVAKLNGLEKFKIVENEIPGGTARIIFLDAAYDKIGSSDQQDDLAARSTEFEQCIATALETLTNWLSTQPISLFDAFSQSGIKIAIFVEMEIDGNQFDLKFPATLMRECGVRSVTLNTFSNY